MRILKTLIGALMLTAIAATSLGGEIYGISADEMDLYRGDIYLRQWQVAKARTEVDKVLATSPDDLRARLLDGRVKFFEGRYDEALETLEKAGDRGEFRDLVKTTRDITQKMMSLASDNFEVYWDSPKDEVLAGATLEALEAARAVLADKLGFAPEGVVRVEIYSSVEDFTAVSTLTLEEVETSGTIGLCKFDRLMITSPRATLWGYRWRDTLSHEYLHMVIYRLSMGNAPIWVHEGIAKYLEGAWRDKTGRIEPLQLALLTRRFAEDTLITLEEMSPSIAKLDSAEDASLAFAEVATMVSFLVERKGGGAITKMLELIAAGIESRDALAEVWGDTFDSFDGAWRGWVEKLPTVNEEIEIVGIELRHGSEEETREPGTIRDPRARDFSRLGDLLRDRGRTVAAAHEYEKAFNLEPRSPPIVSRYAGGRIELGEFAAALNALDQVLNLYEDRAVLWSRKGEALAGLGRWEEAAVAFGEVMEINPFDAGARMGLANAYRELGDTERATRQLGFLETITGEKWGHEMPHQNNEESK